MSESYLYAKHSEIFGLKYVLTTNTSDILIASSLNANNINVSTNTYLQNISANSITSNYVTCQTILSNFLYTDNVSALNLLATVGTITSTICDMPVSNMITANTAFVNSIANTKLNCTTLSTTNIITNTLITNNLTAASIISDNFNSASQINDTLQSPEINCITCKINTLNSNKISGQTIIGNIQCDNIICSTSYITMPSTINSLYCSTVLTLLQEDASNLPDWAFYRTGEIIRIKVPI